MTVETKWAFKCVEGKESGLGGYWWDPGRRVGWNRLENVLIEMSDGNRCDVCRTEDFVQLGM